MTTRVVEQVAIVAPPEKVWAAVTDWERQSEWMALTTVTAQAGEAGVGQRLTAVTGIGPLAFTDPMEVTRWEPPHRADVRHLGRVVRGTGTFLMEPVPGGTRLVWIEELQLPLGVLGQAGYALVGPAFQLLLRASLRRLAQQLEAPARTRLAGSPR